MFYESYVKKMKGEKVPDEYIFRIIDKEGNIKWLSIRSITIEWNGKPATLNFSSNITKRLQAETALRESEEKFRGVIEQYNDGIYVLQDDRFVFINPSYTEMIGYKLEEISGKDFDFNTLIAEEGLMVLEER